MRGLPRDKSPHSLKAENLAGAMHYKNAGGKMFGFAPRLALVLAMSMPVFASHAETERADQQQNANRRAKDGNQQQLQPSMIQHLGKAEEHKKKAEEAREQKNYGKAEDEEKKAMMEAMKAQQLQQQMKANDDSAQQNQAGVDKLRKDDEPTGRNQKALDSTIVDLRISATPSQYQPAKVEPKAPIPVPELVNLDEFPVPVKTTIHAAPSVVEDPGASVKADQGVLAKNNLNLGFDDAAKGEGKTPTVSEKEVSSSQSSASRPATSTGAASIVGGVPGSGSSSGASGEFWTGIGKYVDEANDALGVKSTIAEKLSLKKLRGSSLPGKELSDEAFWKKVGRTPARCNAAADKAGCLSVARRDMERKWEASHPTPAPKATEVAKK